MKNLFCNKIVATALMVLMTSYYALGQISTQYTKEKLISGKDTLQYRMMLPKNFDDSKQYPLVLFLHGAGERGSDNEKQLVHGSSLFGSEENREQFESIVIFPQCPKDDYWAAVDVDRTQKPIKFNFPINRPPTTSMGLVISLLETMQSKTFVDSTQIYVGGLSMGGMGTFDLLARKPETFAAAFAICGGGNPEGAKRYATKTPLWVFHGAHDDVVDPQLSIDMVSAILKAGGHPSFTLYAKDNHNSWDSTFAEPGLLEWLFSNKKL